METPFNITVLIVLTVIVGISAQVLGKYLKVPSIVFLLLFGILLGHDGLNFLHPELLGDGLEVIVSLSVALILFEGGLQLQVRDLAKTSGSLRNLVTIGPLISLIGGGIAAHFLGEFPWQLAFLYAALVIVTGPTVIGPLLKQVQVDRQVATLLEGEGVIIDPVGAIIAVLVLDVIVNGNAEPRTVLVSLITRASIGAAIGGTGGWLLGWFLKRADFLSSDLKTLVALAGVWGLFVLAQYSQDESGLAAAVVAGIVLSAQSISELRLLRRFQGQLTVLAISVLFILLAANLSLASITALGWGGLLTVVTLMLVVRPLNVWICTLKSNLNWRQKLFVSWIGPKGIVSASVASLFAILLTNGGIEGGDAVKALVFLTIGITVVLQGLTAQTVANILQVSAAKTKGAVIVGSNPLARLVARLFQERDEPVVLIDPNPEDVNQAKQENLRVFLSSAIDTEILEKAGLDSTGTFLTMTTNGEVNYLFAQQVIEEFNPPRTLAVLPQDSLGNQLAQQNKVQPAFTLTFPLQRWNQYLTNDEAKLVEVVFENPGLTYQQTYLQALIDAGRLVPLLIERLGQLEVISAGQLWQTGERIICLLQISHAQTTLEKLPRLKEVPMPPLLQDMLRRVSYFENCTEEQLQELMEKGRRQVVQEKQILFRENEPGNSFYIILSGSVEIFSEQSNKILATRYNGEFFGEIAVLMGIPRTASVRALEDTTLFVVNRDGLQNLLSKYPQLAEKIAEELTKREEFLKSSGLLGDESDTEVTALLTKIRSRIQDIFSERRH